MDDDSPDFYCRTAVGANWRVDMKKLAGLTFGIYLCHFPFEYVTYDWLDTPALAPSVRILLGSVMTFAIAAALVWLLSLWRPLRRLVA